MTTFHTISIDGLDIFYREAGSRSNPTILLLHGFPTSSHMFRNLMPALADRFHLVAPDYPSYGNSSMPTVDEFDYTFDRLAEIMEKFITAIDLKKYSLYVMDYGAPIGFRIAAKYPERVEALIVQNGNAYEEGIGGEFWHPAKAYWKDRSAENADKLRPFFTLEMTKWQYTHGVRNLEAISPDTWNMDQSFLDRPSNDEIQLALLYSYGTNPPLYPQWQEYFRQHQPPTLIVWGKNDDIFPAEGAYPYKRDLQTLEFHLLDTGHFALEEEGDAIAEHIRRFMTTHVTQSKMASCQPTFTSIADKNPLFQPGALQMISYQTQLNIARSFLGAISTRDWSAMRALLTENAHWTLPGDNTVSGTANGAEAVVELARKITSYGINFALQHILVSQDNVALSLHNTAQQGDRVLDAYLATVCQLKDSKITAMETFFSDIDGMNAFFV